MTGMMADIPIRLAPLDVVHVAGPLAVLLVVVELVCYWRYGRRPASPRSRLTLALAVGGAAVPAAVVAILHWRPAALLIVGAVLALWAVHSYRRTTSPLSRAARACFVALRLLVILLVVGYLLRPTLLRTEVSYERATLFVLHDTSRSMTIADAGADGQARRIDALRRALDAHADRLAGLDRLFDVRHFQFDQGLGPLLGRPARDLPDDPAGEATAIGRAMRQALQTVPGATVAGVILLTDGAENLGAAGTDPLQVAASLGGPSGDVAFWTVGVGRDRLPGDHPAVLARSLSPAVRRLPAFNVLPVQAVLEFHNLAGQAVTIELLFGQGADERVVDTRVVVPAEGTDRDTATLDLQVTPTQTGFHAVTVRVAPGQRHKDTALAGEHNRLTEYVQVVDELIHVLYVEGKWRLEAQALTRALGGSDLMRLDRRILVAGDALDGGASGLPATGADWQKYHVIVLGDVRANAFTAAQLRTVRDLVREMGKGLMVLGGMDSFGQGGWPGTPIDEVMPMRLSEASGQIAQPFKLTATPQGLSHELMRLDGDPAANARLWQRMPTIQGANRLPDAERIGAGHPGAIVLATTPDGRPVMVAQQAGRGRVLATAIDTTWRWRLHLDDGEDLHGRFWRQAVQWLSNRRGNVWVTTDQPRYHLSQVGSAAAGVADRRRIIVKAGLEDQAGRPVRDDRAALTAFAPPDAEGRSEPSPIALGPAAYRDDHYEVELPAPVRDGSYRLLFEATLDGEPVQAETNFLVESADLELSRPLANFDLLRAVAAAGKAPSSRFYTLDRLGELLDSFQAGDYLVRREERLAVELGDRFRWPLLVLVCALLVVEWLFRKRKNLV